MFLAAAFLLWASSFNSVLASVSALLPENSRTKLLPFHVLFVVGFFLALIIAVGTIYHLSLTFSKIANEGDQEDPLKEQPNKVGRGGPPLSALELLAMFGEMCAALLSFLLIGALIMVFVRSCCDRDQNSQITYSTPNNYNSIQTTPTVVPLTLNVRNFHSEEELKKECSVCMAPCKGDLTELPCSHTFHSNCITHWLTLKASCPYCRQSVKAVETE